MVLVVAVVRVVLVVAVVYVVLVVAVAHVVLMVTAVLVVRVVAVVRVVLVVAVVAVVLAVSVVRVVLVVAVVRVVRLFCSFLISLVILGSCFFSSSLAWLGYGLILFPDRCVAMPRPSHQCRRKSRIHSKGRFRYRS